MIQRFPRLASDSRGTIELRIPPKDIKRLDDPHDDNRYAYECQVPVVEAAKLIIGAANPRSQDLEKPLSRQILSSLQTSPEVFHLKNRGIWLAARRAEYDNQQQSLRVECPQVGEDRYGVVDGGHTKAIIDRFLELQRHAADEKARSPIPYVMLHVRVGVEDNLEEMVVSLNRSTQLKEYSLDDYRGEFDELKQIMSSFPFSSQIGYRENEDKEYDVLDVIQRLTLFCVGIYPNKGDTHPVIAYSSKAKCLQQFIAHKAAYLALEPIIADCFRLSDQIEVVLPEVSRSDKFGRFTFARKQKPRIPASLGGLHAPPKVGSWASGYSVSEAVTYPLAASLRVLVKAKPDGSIKGWREDALEFFLRHGHDLFEIVRNHYNEAGRSLTSLGKKQEFWQRLHFAAYMALHPED